ncbi:MAG: hypothetical protein ACTSR8_22535 [Promethearchaeota archaeon]
MTAKPPEIEKETVHTYWESDKGMCCPLCGKRLTHEFNDGGREVTTLKGPLWVVTNYYRCINSECELNDAFPITHSSCINLDFNAKVKKFSLIFFLKLSVSIPWEKKIDTHVFLVRNMELKRLIQSFPLSYFHSVF